MSGAVLVRDDLVPLLESYGLSALITELAERNICVSDLICEIKVWSRKLGFTLSGLDEFQVAHIISDLVGSGKIQSISLLESNVFDPVERLAAPSGIGCNSENVWATQPGDHYKFRFYVNGIKKLEMEDYYITSLSSIGATSGDTVQIGMVSEDGVVGWWASKLVT